MERKVGVRQMGFGRGHNSPLHSVGGPYALWGVVYACFLALFGRGIKRPFGIQRPQLSHEKLRRLIQVRHATRLILLQTITVNKFTCGETDQ
jgi:hypothetical protein